LPPKRKRVISIYMNRRYFFRDEHNLLDSLAYRNNGTKYWYKWLYTSFIYSYTCNVCNEKSLDLETLIDHGFRHVNYLGLKAEASEASFDAARLIPSLRIFRAAL